jgi:predicted Zn-dependent protease with MMP-like domain
MNIFFRIENKFQKINAKEDFEKLSERVISNIENIFNHFKGEKIIIVYKKQILEFISTKQKDFKILMQENGNNVEQVIVLINGKIDKKLTEFKNSIQNELTDVETKIAKEMESIGISETSLIEREVKFERSLGRKILLGFHLCTLGISTIGYGLLYALPNYLINKVLDNRRYDQFIDGQKDYINRLMKSYSKSIKKNIEKFKKLSLENARRLLGLLKSNNIETDDFWKEAKKQYIKIYSDYKSLKHLD